MSKRKKGAITPRDTVVVQCLQGKRSTVLALSRTLCAGSAGAAAFAATSLTAAARGALPGGIKRDEWWPAPLSSPPQPRADRRQSARLVADSAGVHSSDRLAPG